MKNILFLLTVSCCLLACKSKKEVTEKKAAVTTEEQQLEASIPAASAYTDFDAYYKKVIASTPEDLLTRIQRTPCYGRCPTYILSVYKNGTAEYLGKRFAPREGRFTTQLTQEQLASFREGIRSFEVQNFEDEYDKAGITDLPSTITTFKTEEGFKVIVNRFEAPESLNRLERYIDTFFAEVEWKASN